MRPIAVIDVETTGLNPYRHDRVVEIAAVLLLPGQGLSAEFTTLINPERDIGPTRIHGITATDVVSAPRFSDIAAHLAEFIGGIPFLAGHNVRFDMSFLQSEYRRIGVEMPHYSTIDTMSFFGRRTLSACCSEFGIIYDGQAHAALHDARATARLLEKVLIEQRAIMANGVQNTPPIWPSIHFSNAHLHPRGCRSENKCSLPSFIQCLAERLPASCSQHTMYEGERDYQALLWRVLEDGRIDVSEGESLVEIAMNWGLSYSRIHDIHKDYLVQLISAALSDRTISEVERNEIDSVGQALGFGKMSDAQIEEFLQTNHLNLPTCSNTTSGECLKAKTVCFTGDSMCSVGGSPISRVLAERLAAEQGLRIASTVTKSLDMLVLTDPNSQSGKAKKARQYGIRIIHEPVFWRMLGITLD
jgi:DNA polymerase-3 subunit epsilon